MMSGPGNRIKIAKILKQYSSNRGIKRAVKMLLKYLDRNDRSATLHALIHFFDKDVVEKVSILTLSSEDHSIVGNIDTKIN